MTPDGPEILIGEIVDDEDFSHDNFEKTGSFAQTAEVTESETESKLRSASENIDSLKNLLGRFGQR